MPHTAFGIANGEVDGVMSGTTPLALRKVIQAQYENTGTMSGLEVSGGNGMYYTVAPGVAVTSRGAGDGYALAPWDGGNTPTVDGNGSSNPRLDVVWIAAHDLQHGDSDNFVTVGVTQGTPAASPSKPAIPSYATELETMRVPAGATSTANATVSGGRDYTMPYGASRGVLFESQFTGNQYITGQCDMVAASITVPTDRLLLCGVMVTASANGGVYTNGEGSVYAQLYLDGVRQVSYETRLNPTSFAGSTYFQHVMTVTRGTHAIRYKLEQTKATTASVQLYYQKGTWPGQRLQIIDGGVVK